MTNFDDSCEQTVRVIYVRSFREAIAWTKISLSCGYVCFMALYSQTYILPVEAQKFQRTPSRPLSDREIGILEWVAEGCQNREIAEITGLSPLTVKSHLARIAKQLGTGDRAHLVAIAIKQGIIE